MRLIDADALQKEYMYEHDGKRLMLINVAPTIEPQQTCEYWDSESKFCALCRPSAQPFHNTTMNEVLKYIDDITEDEWQEFTACLECRGWELKRRTAKWCGGDFA